MSQPAVAARAPASAARISELDGLRGIAIALVVIFHLLLVYELTPPSGPLFVLGHIFQVGWIGVDLFFVLSGFLITGILLDSAGRPHYYRNFFVRRSLRIFPLYYVCLVLCAFVMFLPAMVDWNIYLFKGEAVWYVPYIGNIRAFLRNAWPGAALLTPLWSLQVEEQFYWSYPFLVSAVRRKTLAWILAGSIVGAFFARAIIVFAWPANQLGAYLLMPCRMDALAMGGLVALAMRERPEWLKWRWTGRAVFGCAVVFTAICLLFREQPWSGVMQTIGYTVLDLGFTGILILLITPQQNRTRLALIWLCRQPALIWLGTVSYGLYLIHVPVLLAMDKFAVPALHLRPHSGAEALLAISVAVGVASISWVAFESQVLRLKKRFTFRAAS